MKNLFIILVVFLAVVILYLLGPKPVIPTLNFFDSSAKFFCTMRKSDSFHGNTGWVCSAWFVRIFMPITRSSTDFPKGPGTGLIAPKLLDLFLLADEMP